jgi:hypothetical protein
MFGLSKRERTAEAPRRGTVAALIGGFLHPSQVEGLGLNKEATAWIYTDSLVHQLLALNLAYSNSSISNEPWATADFFEERVADAITQHERQKGLSPGTVNSFAFSRLREFSRIERPFLVAGQHFLNTATKSSDRDPRTDKKKVCQLLRTATEAYFQAAIKMF